MILSSVISSSYRLVGVFHGVAQLYCTTYPVHARRTDALGPHIVGPPGLTGFTPCGQHRDRTRHPSRSSKGANALRGTSLGALGPSPPTA